MAAPPVLFRILREPFRRRTWAEFAYALIGLPIGIGGFVFAITTFTLSVGLIVTFIGLPLLALSGLGCRHLGSALRRLANRMLGTNVAAPPPMRRRSGLFGWLGSCLADGTAWRARLYLLLKLPLGILGFVVTITFWVYGLGGITYSAWRPSLPCNYGTGSVCHKGVQLNSTLFLDTTSSIALMAVSGLLLFFAAPWVVRGTLSIDRLLVRLLLGPTAGSERLAELEQTRAAAVDDSAAMLRRIERDLHDGAQARMVSIAMTVGLAREKLSEGSDPADAARLLDTAHTSAKQAVTELRDLARGIHPPVLDAGLDAALATVAAHSPVPVRLNVATTERPEPAIETMAYFCAAELLTNIAKHSGARQAWVAVTITKERLLLTVTDDGHGGAAIGAGTGLRGLAERVATVDGRLTLDSPPGGPTSAQVDLPLGSAGRR